MKWLVLLEGREFYLCYLSKLLDSPELRVIEDHGSYYLSSSHFDAMLDDDDVYFCAKVHLQSIKEVATVCFGEIVYIKSNVVVKIDEDGKRHRYVGISSNINCGEGADMSINCGQEEHFVQESIKFKNWMTLQKQSDKVVKVLHILNSYEHNWVNLYKVYEIIEGEVGSKITKDGWASKEKIKSFTRTTQSPGAIGDDARHGIDRCDPPKNPMSLPEAQSLIISIVRKWLDWKCQHQK